MSDSETQHTLVLGTHSLRLHPVVLLSILDHFIRRNEDEDRVIGALLGVVGETGEVEIRSSFPVPLAELDDGSWGVNEEFFKTMFELHQKVNPKETTLGWYATGTELLPSDADTHEFFAAHIRHASKDLVHPIRLTVDTALTGDKLGYRAYSSAPVGVSEANQRYQFLPVPCEVHVPTSEKPGMNLLLRAREAKDSTLAVATDLDNLEAALTQLQQTLESIQAYVTDIVGGRKAADEVIGRFLMDAITAVPKLDAKQVEQTFNGHVQDLLVVVSLSNMTRAQLALSERMMHVFQ